MFLSVPASIVRPFLIGVLLLLLGAFALPAFAQTEVPSNWPLKPSDLNAGDQFRLLLVVEETRDATDTSIGSYDSFVRAQISANGHGSIRAHSSSFKVLGSTTNTAARDHTGTTYTATDTGVPIYWLNGSKLADDYEDFYDGTWTNKSSARYEDGTNADTSNSSPRVCTGSNDDGTPYSFVNNNGVTVYEALGGRGNGSGNCRAARLGAANGTLNNQRRPATEAFRYFALSGVFEVGSATVAKIDDLQITSSAGSTSPGEYVAGDDVEFTVTFSEAVTVTGAPKLNFHVNGSSGDEETRQADHVPADSTSTELVFSYEVADTDYDHDGISLPAGPIDLNGGSISAQATGSDADLSFDVQQYGSHKIHLVPDTATSTQVISTPASAANGYVTGETIRVAVTWNRNVRAVTEPVGMPGDPNHLNGGTPALVIMLDSSPSSGGPSYAAYSQAGGDKTLYFDHVVQPGDFDDDGLVTNSDLILNSGFITHGDVADSIARHIRADQSVVPLPQQTAHKVNVNRPTVSSLAVTSSPASGDTYETGETVKVGVTFSKAVTVDTANGTPRLEMELQSASEGAARHRHLDYASGSGNSVLVFEYVVQAGESDDDGIKIGADALSANGGTIRDSDSTDAVLDHSAPGTDGVFSGHKIDGGTVVAVTVSFDAASYTATEDGTDATVTVNLSADPEREVIIPIVGTGKDGGSSGDFSLAPATVTIASGSTSGTFKVRATDDDFDDDGETVELSFDGLPNGVTAGSQSTASVSIADDDTRGVVYSTESVRVDEGKRTDNIFTMALTSQPTRATLVEMETAIFTNRDRVDMGIGDRIAVVFDGSNWNTPQPVHMISADRVEENTTLHIKPVFSRSGDRNSDYVGLTVPTVELTIVDRNKPRVDGATVDGDSLVLTYDQDLDPDSVPAPGDFEVTVAGSSVSVSGVSIRGKKVTLTLATPAAVGDEAAISYTVPGSNPIQDEDENAAGAIADKAVTNNTPDTTAPGLSSANIVGDTLVLAYDETLDSASTPAASAFAVTVAGSSVAVSNVSVSDKTVTLTLASEALDGDAVTLSYTVPTNNPIRDEAENTAAALTDRSVTNNTAAVMDASLTALSLTDGNGNAISLSPVFASGTGSYTASVAADMDQVTIAATASNGSATVAYTPSTDAETTEDDHQVNLAFGDNTLRATVTAADGITSETYSIRLTRARAAVAYHASSMNQQVTEDNTSITFTVTLTPAMSESVVVNYATEDYQTPGDQNHGYAGHDYTAASGSLTFAAGETSKTFQVPILEDSLDEDDERLFVTLSLPANTNNAELSGSPTAVPLIIDDDPEPSIGIAAASADEGDPVTFTVSLSEVSGRDVRVDYATSIGNGDSATSGVDFTAADAETLTIPAGAASATLSIATAEDSHYEDDETFTVTLSSPVAGTLSSDPLRVKGTITNDDVLEQVTGVTTAPGDETLTIGWTAVAGAGGYKLQWKSGTQEYSATSSDNRQATISSGTTTSHEFTGLINDTEYTVRIAATHSDTDDGAWSVEKTGTPTPPNTPASGAPTISGEASVGEELTADTGGIADANGKTMADDNVAGHAYAYQWIRVDSDGVSNATDIANATSGKYTLVADDEGKKIKVKVDFTDDRGYAETSTSAAYPAAGTVGPRKSSDATLSALALEETDGTSISLSPGFASGRTSYTASVAADVTRITIAATATHSAASVAYTPATDADTVEDGHQVNLSVGENTLTAVVTAEDESTQSYTVTVTRKSNDATLSALALEETDGTSISLDRTFASGRTSYTAEVEADVARITIAATATHSAASVAYTPSTDADTVEDGHQVNLSIGETTLTVVATAEDESTQSYTVTVTRNPPKAAIAAGHQVTEDNTTLTFTVTLTPAVDETVVVDYDTYTTGVGDFAAAGEDYTAVSGSLTFAANETSRTFDVNILEDAADENDETFFVRLLVPAGATNVALGFPFQTILIIDDDDPPTIGIADASGDEGDPVSFTVSLSAASGKDVSFRYTTSIESNDTATSGADFTAVTNRTVTIAPGNASTTLTVDTIEDSAFEDDETFTVTLSGPPSGTELNAILPSGTAATGTIVDDEKLAKVSGVTATAGDSKLTIEWTAVSLAEGYKVQWKSEEDDDYSASSTDNREAVISSGTTTSHALTGLTNGLEYTVRVAATHSLVDDGAWSSEASGTPSLPGTSGPDLSSATVSGTTLVLTYDEDIDPDSAPAAGDFAVTVAGSSVTVSAVEVSGKTITLTLATAAAHGDTVRLSYTVPVSNPVQDEDGNEAVALTGQAVTNNTPDTTAPALSTATVDGTSLTLTYDETLDTASTPAAGDFAVTVAGSSATVSTVEMSGQTVTLTLATRAPYGDAVSLSYTVPANNPIQDEAGNDATALSGQAVTNNTASTAVALTLSPSSVAESAGATSMTVTGTLDGAPRTGDTAVTVSVGASGDGAAEGTDYAAVDDATLTIDAGETSGTANFSLTPTDDDLDEDDETLSIAGRTAAAGLDVTPATVTIVDDDTRGVEVSATTLSMSEGGSATYTVVLTSQPTATVTVTPSVSGDSDVTVSPTSLDFTTSAWSTALTVTVAAAQDSDSDDDEATVAHAVSGGDYADETAGGVTVTVLDDEAAPSIVAGGVEVTSFPRATHNTYGVDETIAVSVTFDADVEVNTTGGTPYFKVEFKNAAANAIATEKHFSYASGSGSATLVFEYEVQAADRDNDGIRIGSNALVLDGGTIRDTDSRDAQLTHAGAGRQGGHRVDGSEVVGPAELSLFHIRSIDGGTILPSSPNFDPETTAYTASVPYSTRWIRVRALGEEGGERTILPADVEPNTEWHEVALGVGPNEITVTASRTGVPDRTYTMTVTRAKPTVTIAAAESSTTYRLEDLSFTVTRNLAIDEALDVNVAFEQDQDFLPASGLSHAVSIPANETSATLTLETGGFTGGATADGTLTAAIAESDGYNNGAPDSASVDFVVADPALTVRFDNVAYVFLEDAGAVTLDIVAETAPGVVLSDAFSLSVLTLGDQDSAVSGSDYILGSGGVTFRAADFAASNGALAATRSIDLTLLDDSATEGEESFRIQLLATGFPPAATVVQGDGTDCPSEGCRSKVTIVDDESPPPQVTGVKVTPGVGSLIVDWTAVADATGYKVQWKSGTETFSDAGTDDREATVSSGSTTSHTITGLTDGTAYTVRVIATRTGASGDGPASAEATGTAGLPTLTIADASATEGDAVEFTVSLSPAADQAVTVLYAASDGTATADGTHEDGADYTAPASDAALIFDAGETSATISIATGGDTVDEDDETFTVTLSDASSNAVLGTVKAATGTIVDDDTDPAQVTGGAFENAPESGAYALGDVIEVSVTFDTAVEVTGAPRVRLAMSGTAASASYALYDADASTETVLAFRRAVTADDDDADAISVAADGLELNGASILNKGTTVGAVLGHDAVQGGDIRTRSVEGIAVTSEPEVGAPAPEGIYGPGEMVSFTVTFAAAVTVDDSGGDPELVFIASDGARQEAAYASGSGTTSLVFTWTVPSDVPGAEGAIEVPANTTGGGMLLSDGGLVLNGATIEDAQSRAVNIRHGAYATGAKVDTTAPVVASGAAGATVAGTTLVLAFEKAAGVADHLDAGSVPAATNFAVLVAGSARTVSGVAVDDASVKLTLASAVGHAQAVTVNYTPGTDPIRDLWGNAAAEFSGRSVRNDSPEPALSIADVTVAEDAGTATFTVTPDVVSGEAVTVDYATSDDTAEAGSDYTAASGTVSIAAGAASATFEVTVTDDAVGEGDEAFTVTLSDAVNATIARAAATGTITDDETPTLTIADASATEGDAVEFTVSLSPAADAAVTVLYATSDGTATSDATHEDGADYTAPASDAALTIAAGKTSATITIATGNDAVFEDDETFTVTLSDPSSNAVLGSAKTATGIIENNDDASTDAALKALTLKVGGSDVDLTPVFAATTYSYEVDVANTAATVNVVAESNHGKATVAISGDDDTTSPGEAALPMAFGENAVTVTVRAKDGDATQDYTVKVTRALPALAWDHTVYYVGEDAGEVTLTVTLTPASIDEVTVDYATSLAIGSATAGEDFIATSGTLTFEAGETEKTVKVTILDDTLYEPDGAGDVFVELSNPTGTAVLGKGLSGALLFMEHGDNDVPPSATMENVTVDEDAGTMEFTLSLSHGVEADGLQFFLASSEVGGTATAGSDYESFLSGASASLAIPSRATSATFSVSILDDDLDEDDETITMQWKHSDLYVAEESKSIDVTGTITDDDERGVAVSAATLTVPEGNTATYTVVLTSEPTDTVTVTPSLATGSSSDVTFMPTSLTFGTEDWDSAQSVTVSAGHDDDAVADAATIEHAAAGGDYASAPAGEVSVTVTDDEQASTAVALSVDVTSVDEDAGATTIKVTGTLNGGTIATATDVEVSVGAGTAAASDFAAVSDFTLTIDAGETSGTASFSLTPTNDDVDEADETVSVTGTTDATDLTVTGTTATIVDDDERGVAISAPTLTVPEGGSASYTVVLTSQPTAGVTVTPSRASGSTDVTFSPSSLSFTTGDWSTAKTMTVSAAQDDDAEADEATLSHAVSGGDYASETASDVAVTVGDDETVSTTVALSVNPASVDEDAEATSITVTGTLDGAPRTTNTIVTVSVGASGDGATEGTDYATVADLTLTIDAGETSGTASFTLTPTHDDVDEADETLTVAGTHKTIDVDVDHDNLEELSVTGTTATIVDDDTRGVTISPIALTVSEGNTATYTVVLTSQPTATVTVTPSRSSGSSDVTFSPASLSFGTGDWSTAKTVTVSAAQDDDAEADEAVLSHAVSGGDYASETASDVAVTVGDDETASTTVALSVNPASIDEDAEATSITVTGTLDGAPRTTSTIVTVLVGASGDGATEGTDYGTVADLTLTIDAGETSGTATFSLTPTDDDVDESDETLSVTGTTDATGLTVTGTTATIVDDDERGVAISPIALTVSEGNTATYTVVLTSQPTATVTVTPSRSSGSSDVTFSPASLSFGTGDWSTAKTVTVLAAQDDDAEDDEAVLSHAVSGGDYASETASSVDVTVGDDETVSTAVALSVNPASVDEDAGATATSVTVTGTLDGAPRTADTTVTVTVGASGDGAAEGTDYATVADLTLTIDAGETSGTATFSLTPTDDDVDEGDEALSVTGTTTATDLTVTATAATIVDDDERGVTVSAPTLTVPEGSTATYTVVLTSQPTATVTVTPSRASGSGDVTFSPASLSFGTGDWNTAKTVTVSAAQDDDAEDDEATLSHAVSGGDYGANSVTASGVAVSVDDDETVSTAPGPVTELSAEGVATGVSLTWTAPAGPIRGYLIEVSFNEGASWAAIGDDTPPGATSYFHLLDMEAGETRLYRVSTIANDGTTSASAPVEATATTEAAGLTATGIAVQDVPDGMPAIDVCWTPENPSVTFLRDFALRFKPTSQPGGLGSNWVQLSESPEGCDGGRGVGTRVTAIVPNAEFALQFRARYGNQWIVSDVARAISLDPTRVLRTEVAAGISDLSGDTLVPDTVCPAYDDPATLGDEAGSFFVNIGFTTVDPVHINYEKVDGFVVADDVTVANGTAELVADSFHTQLGYRVKIAPTIWGEDVVVSVPAGAVTHQETLTPNLDSNEFRRKTSNGEDCAPEAAAPIVSLVEIYDGTPSDGSWPVGDVIRVSLRFTEAMAVSTAGGVPSLTLRLGDDAAEVQATYSRIDTRNDAYFEHAVTTSQGLVRRVELVENSLTLNGGRITAAFGEIAAELAHLGASKHQLPRALTATWEKAPRVHPGKDTTFVMRLKFNRYTTISPRDLREHAVSVTGGTIDNAWRVKDSNGNPSSRLFAIRVVADSDDRPVTLSLTADRECSEQGAICTADGALLSNAPSVTISNPSATIAGPSLPGLSIGDAEVEEGPGAKLAFAITLDRAATGTVTVDASTSDGTAVAGEDYRAKTLTKTFAPGETRKVAVIRVLDDSHDEGTETMTLTLSNPVGAYIADGEAVGTITNSDLMPQAWLARFGRTVADQVIEAVEGRVSGARNSGTDLTVAGQAFGGADAGEASEDEMREAEARLERLSTWFRGADDEESLGLFETRAVDGREVLAGTSFALTEGTAESGFGALWGRGAVTRFDGREDELSLDGEVESALLGADVAQGRWAAGLAVGHSRAEGGYNSPQGDGAVESTLTGVYPYGRYDVNDWLTLWGVVGMGTGSLTLTPEGMDPIETDMDLTMAALGGRSVLLEAPADGGLELAATSDAMVVQTTSDEVRGSGGSLAAAEADVTRLRIGLEGAWRGIGALEPSFEIGLRQDGGDAETGFGADVGAGLAWTDPERGIAAELRARGLLTHEDSSFRERGFAGSFAWDPDPASDLGPSLTLRQTVGAQASGGVDALLRPDSAERLIAVNDDEGEDGLRNRRLEATLGYGLSTFGGRYVTTPALGFGLTEVEREYSHSWRLAEARGEGLVFGLDVEAVRRERVTGDAGPEHRFVFGLGWLLEGARRKGAALELRLEGAHSDTANDNASPETLLRIKMTTRW